MSNLQKSHLLLTQKAAVSERFIEWFTEVKLKSL